MRLYMKQKVFSWKDKATVTDEYGNEKYFVEGQIISVGKKLHITDALGNEAAFVRQKAFSLMPKFFVEINGQEVAEISKKFTFLKPKYIVNGPNWEIGGDVFGHDYTITEGGRPVVAIHKKWMSWGDSYELNIDDGANEVLALAVVLAIDAVLDAQQAAAAASSD